MKRPAALLLALTLALAACSDAGTAPQSPGSPSASSSGSSSQPEEGQDTAPVYLMTSARITWPQWDISTSISWEYDDQGRLLKYTEDETEIRYTYNDAGTITAFQVRDTRGYGTSDGDRNEQAVTIDFTGVYDGPLLTGYTGSLDGEELTFSFSYGEDKSIQALEVSTSPGEPPLCFSYAYHDGGQLKEVAILEDPEDPSILFRFDPQGHLTGCFSDYQSDENFGMGYEAAYDDRGSLTYTGITRGNRQIAWTYTWEYDQDGTPQGVKKESQQLAQPALGTFSGTDTQRTLTYDDGTEYRFQYDQAGNLLRRELYINNGTLVEQAVYTYTAFEAPGDYTPPRSLDPRYGNIFLLAQGSFTDTYLSLVFSTNGSMDLTPPLF